MIRFVFGSGLVKRRKESENTARAIIQSVAIQYAEDTWDQLKKNLRVDIANDVRRELSHMAQLYRRHIIGAGPRRSGPSGTLATVTKGEDAPTRPIREGLPSWAPRNARYLERKNDAIGHKNWFDNTGWEPESISKKGVPWPDRGGYLKAAFASGTRGGNQSGSRGGGIFEDMFGPIGVRIVRNNLATTADATLKTAKGRNLKLQIASIYVTALGRIDRSMLNPSASGNPGLMNLVGNYDPLLAVRLGPRRNGVYRPTLEPFLDFFLERALPHAVSRRIEKGTLGSIIR